jgi:general secretion pathway protein D
MSLENAGNFKAVLNAFAANDQVTILSTPRLLVKSGSKATLDVGSDVPLVTTQSSGDIVEGGTSSILQEIQYRKTGVLLEVEPIVHAGRRVDINVTQEISQAQPNTISDINSPSILLRRVNTSLSLRDGGSVLLGGMISRDNSTGRSGVPLLMDIPLIGNLFSVQKKNETRTELIIMLSPYVITTDDEAESLTEEFRMKLSGGPH